MINTDLYAPASALDATGSRNTTVLGGLFGPIFDLSPLVTENCEKKTRHSCPVNFIPLRFIYRP